MIISEHAEEEMQRAGISREEVKRCLEYGNLEIKHIIKGETRYGKKLILNDKTIMVIYIIKNNEKRVVTTYTIRRKKIWIKK